MKLTTSSLTAVTVFCILMTALLFLVKPQIQTLMRSRKSGSTLLALTGAAMTDLGTPPPSIPHSALKYQVIGAPIKSFFIEFKFEESYYDYSFTVDVDPKPAGLLHMEPPPEDMPVQMHITATAVNGKQSFIKISNKEWWEAVSESTKEYALYHTFFMLF